MNKRTPQRLITVWLLSTLILVVQSCDDKSISLEKSKVEFSLNPGIASDGRMKNSELPENALLRLSIESRSGSPILTDHELKIVQGSEGYVADPLDLLPGNYVITEFMIVNDSDVLNAVPKTNSLISELAMNSLPYNFSVAEGTGSKVSMQVIDVRNEKPEAFGYTSFRLNRMNTLSFIVSRAGGTQSAPKEVTAELRQGKHLVKTFPVNAGVNKIAFDGDQDATYTLSVYGRESAKVKTFNLKELKKELGPKPLKLELEPALVLSLESSVDEGNENEEYFEFVLDGTSGAVNVNWGDGYETPATLPLSLSHEYTMGTYTAVITGDLKQITNLYGFSYGTIIYGINGLTNLTALKTYNPSWGAVPIKIDLSKCTSLETIYIEKLGAPYESIDLRKDFRLPEKHLIDRFVFYVPSLDPTRENISTAELDVLVNNIFNNATRRHIYDGDFFVYPVDTPSPEAQKKLDILKSKYNWDVRLDGNIWDDYAGAGRTKQHVDTRRENWLRQKFPERKRTSRAIDMAL